MLIVCFQEAITYFFPYRPMLTGMGLLCFCLLIGCYGRETRYDAEQAMAAEQDIWVSEAFPNRNVLDTTAIAYSVHGAHCNGFLDEQFDPQHLTPALLQASNLDDLEQVTQLSWQTHTTRDSVINFTHLFQETNNRVVYVAERIETEQAEEIVLSIGTDDGYTLWLNGDTVRTNHRGRVLKRHDDLVALNLRPGPNIVLYKIDQGDGGWALYRRILAPKEVPGVLEAQRTTLYADILESSILPDSARFVPLTADRRRSFDEQHRLRFKWVQRADEVCIDTTALAAYEYPAHQLPTHIALPEPFGGWAQLEVTVLHQGKGVEYVEYFDVMYESRANSLAARLTQPIRKVSQTWPNPTRTARVEAVRTLYKLPQAPDVGRAFSTRMRAHALADLWESTHEPSNGCSLPSGPHIHGYSLDEEDLQTYRLFAPASVSADISKPLGLMPLVLLSYGIQDKPSFWASKEGASHALMAERAAWSIQYGTFIAMPHGYTKQNYARDFIAIPGDLAEKGFPIDTTDISVLVFSLGIGSFIDAMIENTLPVTRIGIISPVFPENESQMLWAIEQIKARYPGVRWFIRHGLDDHESPIHITRRWVRHLQEAGFQVDYAEVPHSSHWVYLSAPEEAFYTWVNETQSHTVN